MKCSSTIPVDSATVADPHKQAVARQYSQEWEYWNAVYEDSPGSSKKPEDVEYAHRLDLILRVVDNFAGGHSLRIMDAGCGTGILIRELVARGHSAVGVDISPKMAEVAQHAADKLLPGRARCLVGDIEKLPFEDGAFDVVIAAGVLSHQLDDRPSIRELRRVVKQDGIVIVTLPNRLKLRYLLEPYCYAKAVKGVMRWLFSRKNGQQASSSGFTAFMKNDLVSVRKYYYRQLNRLFRENSLNVLEHLPCGFGPLTFFGKVPGKPEFWQKFSKRMEHLAHKRCFHFLNIFATFWIIQLDPVTPIDGTGA